MAAMTPDEIRTRIDEITAIIRSGASSVTLDGLTVSFDLDELKQERKELEKQIPGGSRRRRIAYRNRLG